jgi:hypothetical protein
MKTYIDQNPLTNGELKSIQALSAAIVTDYNAEALTVLGAASLHERLTSLNDRLQKLPNCPETLQPHYPDFVEDFSTMHVKAGMATLTEECRPRGIKVTPGLRRIVGSLLIVGLRMGMIMAAKLMERGLSPVVMLLAHGQSRIPKDPSASELRMIDRCVSEYEHFVDGFIEHAASGAWRGGPQGGSVE